MRPRYLEIEGLQSFKEVQKIDFDRLSETGLFGIFGPTGSGKSTVLDAITLALYGEVNRALSGTQGIINTSMNTVRVSFVFDLKRGDQRKTYKVERLYARKKGSVNSCEAKQARLMEVLEDGYMPLADKPREVTAKVEELLGLKHDDFTRAVVLPQNKFQEFLMMEKSKKRDMLERIFYLEEYGKQLSEKVSKKITNLKAELAGVSGALSALGDASDEALKLAEKGLNEADKSRKNAIKAFDEIDKIYQEAKNIWQLTNELEVILKKEHELQLVSEEIKNKKNKLEKSIKTEGIIDLIKDYKTSLNTLTEITKELEHLQKVFPQLTAELESKNAEYETAKSAAENEKPKLLERRTRLYDALQLKKDIEKADIELKRLRTEFITLRERINEKQSEIVKKNELIKSNEENIIKNRENIAKMRISPEYRDDIRIALKLEDELINIKNNIEKQKAQKDLLNEKITLLQKKADEIGEISNKYKSEIDELSKRKSELENIKPGNLEDISRERGKINQAVIIYSSLSSRKNEIDKLQARISELNKNSENLRLELDRDLTAKKDLENEKKLLDTEIEELKKLVEKNAAYMLAKNLKEGEACPVCGSVHHPNPAYSSEKEDISSVEQKLSIAESKAEENNELLRKTENQCAILGEKIKDIDVQIKLLNNDLSVMQNDFNEFMSSIPEPLKSYGYNELEKAINDAQNKLNCKMQETEKWNKQYDELSSMLEDLNGKLSTCMVEQKGIETELQVNIDNLKQVENALKSISDEYNTKREEYSVFINKYKIESAAAESKRIAEKDSKIESLQAEIDKLQDMINNTRNEINIIQNDLQQLINKKTETETDGKNLKLQLDEKQKKIRDLAGDCDIENEIRIVENKIDEMGNREKMLLDGLKALQETHNNMSVQITSLQSRKDVIEKGIEADRIRLGNMLKEKGFADFEEVEASALSKEEQEAVRKDIDDYEQKERNIQAQKEITLKKLNGNSMDYEKWEAISAEYKQKSEEKEEAISKYEVAKNIYRTTKMKNEQWAVLNEQYKTLSTKAGLLDQIRSLLKGNTFVEYVAEERLRYVARAASETLGEMTKYRYSLEIDPDYGFVVCDNANGGVRRMVNSLSGGETFMTSLSLALALSKQIQLKGQSPLEFFFLDEGFGTLDLNLLDTVIDSLEKLSSTERVIGVISHVQELKNRILRRLIVEPPTQDGKGSHVRIEKA